MILGILHFYTNIDIGKYSLSAITSIFTSVIVSARISTSVHHYPLHLHPEENMLVMTRQSQAITPTLVILTIKSSAIKSNSVGMTRSNPKRLSFKEPLETVTMVAAWALLGCLIWPQKEYTVCAVVSISQSKISAQFSETLATL